MAGIGKVVGVLNLSKSCEPSAYLFHKAVAFLEANDYTVRFDSFEGNEILLINSCCATILKMLSVKKTIDRAVRTRGVKRVVIFGCLGDLEKIDLVRDPRIRIIGSRQLAMFDDVFPHRVSIHTIEADSLDRGFFSPYRHGHTMVEDHCVLISQGCAHRCSYCNIKKSKGHVTSRPHQDILHDVRALLRRNIHEFVLLSDDCGSYGLDIGSDFARLLKEIVALDGRIRVKINYFFPGDLLRLYSDLREVFCRGKVAYINVPVQSGSARILKLMNREYDLVKLKAVLKEIKALCPGLWLHTHIIVHFPTETCRDFRRSLELATVFDDFILYPYSDNPLTPAFSMTPKVGERARKARKGIAADFISRRKTGFYAEVG
jgi:MiaB/RimO family radical SAM methylthiotransferase